jgi:GntR family transcriptional regulator
MSGASFFEQFRRGINPELPKHAQVREILVAAIAAGHWKPGEQLPNENALTQMTPFSLGTIQRALRDLAAYGLLERRQGAGSFVARSSRLLPYPLHCRFLNDANDGFLPIFSTTLRRGRAKPPGPWVGRINDARGRIIRIDRRIDVNHEFLVYSQFYASEGDLGSLLKCPLRKLDGQNFKLMIAEEMQLPITSIGNHARAQVLPRDATEIVGVARDSMGLCVEAIALSAKRAIYLQLFFIPPTDRLLVLSPTSPESAHRVTRNR